MSGRRIWDGLLGLCFIAVIMLTLNGRFLLTNYHTASCFYGKIIRLFSQAHTGGESEFAAVPDDAYFERQWPVRNDGSFWRGSVKANADIQLLDAWKIEKGDSNIIVAILDGGCNFDEPDLYGRFWTNKNEIPGNGFDDDHNGYTDDLHGWNFVDSNNKPDDIEGHGTNVAGIVGANADNNIGYSGVDWKCKLMICRVTDEKGRGLYKDWANAIRYAVANGARVINMSVGGKSPSKELQDAIDYAYYHNVVVVAAMMNTNTSTPYYPAACRHVIAVGATNPDDTRAQPFFWSDESGSNYGKHITVVAPGNYIYGLSTHGYNTCWGGTSQAAPFVSGLASLLAAQDPHRTVDEIIHIITSTAQDQVGTKEEDTPGWDSYYGYGRINAYHALQSGLQAQK